MFILATDAKGREVGRKDCERFDGKKPLQNNLIRSSLKIGWVPLCWWNLKISLVLSQGEIITLKKIAKKLYVAPCQLEDLAKLLHLIGRAYVERAVPMVFRENAELVAETMDVHNGISGKKSRRYVAPAISCKRLDQKTIS